MSVHFACITETSKSLTLQYDGIAFQTEKFHWGSRPIITTLRLRCGTRTVKAHHFAPASAEVAAAVITYRLLEYASSNDSGVSCDELQQIPY